MDNIQGMYTFLGSENVLYITCFSNKGVHGQDFVGYCEQLQKSMIIQQLTADLEECLIQYNIITLYTLLEWICDLYIESQNVRIERNLMII